MAVNIFSELLAAIDPSQLGQRLTEQLRELTGARTVMLVAHPESGDSHVPIHTCPARRRELFSSQELRQFCPDCTQEMLPFRVHELSWEHPLRRILEASAVKSILRFPLRVGGELVATVILLDLPSLERIDETHETVTHLSPVMALALKNSVALARVEAQAKELDRRVAERTADLEAANHSLAASRLAAVSMMNDAIMLRQQAEKTAEELHREIGERKRAEEELRRFKAIFDSANFGTAIVGLDGTLVYVNEFLASTHGFPVAELTGQPISRLHNDQQQAGLARLLQKLITDGAVDAEEVEHCRRDGSTFPMLMTGQVVKDANGVAQCFTTSAIDLSERKALENQLRQAQKMESVGRLAGGVAHDFNNMLGVILGHADLVIEQLEPETVLNLHLAEIRKAAARSVELTRQLLAFARKQTIAPQVLELNEVVAGMLNMLKRLMGENINLEWTPGAELWRVYLDPSQIDQILANLCVNARDAINGHGRMSVATRNHSVVPGAGANPEVLGDYVVLSVSDTGCGMDKETLSHLFEPFFTTKEVGKGTGLGLATVYGCVKQNGGFIEVASEPGRGTSFNVYLPRWTGRFLQARNAPATNRALGGRETILVVEDEPAILSLATKVLQRLGYTVLAANTPYGALRLAREHSGAIHLLMTDVVMPEMNGRDLAKELLKSYPKLKRLFMSGYTADVIAPQGVLAEGVHFIPKPFSANDLATKVRNVCDSE